jgi:hypothetical protein
VNHRRKHQNVDDDSEDFWTLADQQVDIANRHSKRINDDDTVDNVSLTDDNARHRHASWLTPPLMHNNVAWLLRYITEDVKSRSLYLNAINTKTTKQPSFLTLPKPFFAPSLRANTATIIRIIR